MAPCWDLYVRLPDLDRLRVERFLEARVTNWRAQDSWQVEGAQEVLTAGLSGSRRGDVLYASRTLDPDLDYVIVAFGRDGAVVLGVSIDMRQCHADEAAVLPHAKHVLAKLLEETGAAEAFIQAEYPPPLSAEEWAQGMAYSTYRIPTPPA